MCGKCGPIRNANKTAIFTVKRFGNPLIRKPPMRSSVIPAQAGIQALKLFRRTNPAILGCFLQSAESSKHLNLPLPQDGGIRPFMRFKIDQQVDIILGSEPVDYFILMLPRPTWEVRRNPDIQRAIAFTRDDINKKTSLPFTRRLDSRRRGNDGTETKHGAQVVPLSPTTKYR